MKIKNTKRIENETFETVYPEEYKTAKECENRIKAELEITYGEDWELLHGDDLSTDENGNPYYEFDMGDGDFERYEVVQGRQKGDAFDIPNILESLAKDIENGSTWDEVAAELVKAGWLTCNEIEGAKRLVSPYLIRDGR